MSAVPPTTNRKATVFFCWLLCGGLLVMSAGAAVAPLTSELAKTVSVLAAVLLMAAAVAALLCLVEVRSALGARLHLEIKRWKIVVALVGLGVLGFLAIGAAQSINASNLRVLGFASDDELRAAQTLGLSNGAQYRAHLHVLEAKRAKAAAEAAQRRLAQERREQEEERLVIGRWILPVRSGGYILTIRRKGNGYEALMQSLHDERLTDPVTMHRTGGVLRYDKHDSFGTSFVVLADGRLNVRDNQGSVDILEKFAGHPSGRDAVDAAIQNAFDAAEEARADRRAAEGHARNNPQEAMALKIVSWQKGGFGIVMLGTFKVTNNNDFDVKDVTILCAMAGPSGTTLSAPSVTVYRTVKAKSSATFRDVNVGLIDDQVTRGACGISAAVRLDAF